MNAIFSFDFMTNKEAITSVKIQVPVYCSFLYCSVPLIFLNMMHRKLTYFAGSLIYLAFFDTGNAISAYKAVT